MSITPIVQEFDENDDFMSMIHNIEKEEAAKGFSYDNADLPVNTNTGGLTLNDNEDDFLNFVKREQEKEKTAKEFNVNNIDVQNPVKPDNTPAVTEEMVKQLESTPSSGDHTTGYTDEVWAASFDFIREAGILNMPDDMEFNSENLPKILEYDQDLRNQAALDFVKEQAGDEAIASLFDLVWNGGTFQDLQVAKDIVSDEQFFKNLDLDNEENQKLIITQFFKEALNPNAPTYEAMVSELPAKIDSIIANYKGKEEAEKARAYFLDVIDKSKKEFENQKIERIKEEEKIKIQKLEREQAWRKQFLTGLNNKTWTSEKKNEVVAHFNKVKLQDGTELPLWDYKMKKIWENPEHAQHLFRFLSDFDPYKLEFKTQDKTPTQLATSKILEMANKKTVSKTVNTESKPSPLDGRKVTDEELARFLEERGR